jgi:hypothetical protein
LSFTAVALAFKLTFESGNEFIFIQTAISADICCFEDPLEVPQPL